MRRRPILLGTLALAVVLVTIGGVAYVLHARAQAQADEKLYPGLHGPVAVECPGPRDPLGGQGFTGRGIRPHNNCTPSFTQQDVRDYFAQVPLHLAHVTVTGQPTVTRVVFLTLGDLKHAERGGGWPSNASPDMLLCYVELRGTFFLDIGQPVNGDTVSFVYDAHTGNQLQFNAGPLFS